MVAMCVAMCVYTQCLRALLPQLSDTRVAHGTTTRGARRHVAQQKQMQWVQKTSLRRRSRSKWNRFRRGGYCVYLKR